MENRRLLHRSNLRHDLSTRGVPALATIRSYTPGKHNAVTDFDFHTRDGHLVQTYVSNKNDLSNAESHADVGSQATVFYDRDNPTHARFAVAGAILQRDFYADLRYYGTIGIAMMAYIVWFFRRWLRKIDKSKGD